jgi:hypothetical protein
MKKFNNIYKLLLVLPLIFMVGCDDSDDIVDVFTNTTTTAQSTVFIETDDTHSNIVTTANYLEAQTVTAGVNNAPDSDITVAFSVTRNGSPATLGQHYTVSDATILSGENFGSSSITFTASGLFDVSVASASNGSLVVNNKVTFEVEYEKIAIRIDWESAFYDYDLYLYEGNQDFTTLIDNTFDVTNFEYFEFDSLPLGESSLWIDDWWGDNASIPVVLSVFTADGLFTFDVVMDMDKWVLLINTTDAGGGLQSYTLTAL